MRNRLLLTIGYCLAAAATMGQGVLPDTAMDYNARFTELNKAYVTSPTDVKVMCEMALFYFDNSNPLRNLPMAMDYIQRAERHQVWLIEHNENGELRRLLRNGITIASIRQTKQAIGEAARNTVKARFDMSKDDIDAYITAFGSDAELVGLLRQRRIDRDYEEDLQKGTAESYYHYIELYTGTTEAGLMENRLSQLAAGLFSDVVTEEEADAVAARFPLSPSVQRAAQKKKSSLAFAVAERKNSLAAYRDFLSNYPSSDESQWVRDHLDKMLEVIYSNCKTAMDYAVFAQTYPDIPLSDKALARARQLIEEQHDVVAARYYLEHFQSAYNDVCTLYYSWHAVEGNGEPINRFIKEFPDYIYQRNVDDDLRLAATIDRINLLNDFLEEEYPRYADYVRQMTGKGIAIVPLQRMIQGLTAARNYRAALERMRKFELSFENVPEYKELQNILSAPATGRKAVHEFAETYSVMNPAVNESDGRLYYTRVAGNNRRICYAVKNGAQWQLAGEVLFDGPVENDGLTLFGFYDEGRKMLLGADGNIMMAEREDSSWRVTDIPPYPVNTDYIETDAYMLPDGSGMLLASDRPGGYNLQTSGTYFHGDTALATDLYFISYTGGSWGSAVNLGTTVNTPYSERFPILSRNLKTLYFVTDGRGGLGYGDIYVATRSDVQDWTSWSTPQNAGKEINSGHNETGLSFGLEEKNIFMAVNSSLGTYACYSFPTWHNTATSSENCTVALLGMDDALMRVMVADMEQQTVMQVVECQGESDVVTANVISNRSYAVIGDAGPLFVPAIIVTPPLQEHPTLRGYSFTELVRMGRALSLEAVGFADSSLTLTPVAQIQLSQLARFLLHNPSAVVEICVDVSGFDDRLCYNRSVEQGDVVRNFLNLSGVDISRITISPYGNVNTKKQGRPGISVKFREKTKQ